MEVSNANLTGSGTFLNSQNRGPFQPDTPPELVWGCWFPASKYKAISNPLLLLSHAGIPISNGQRVHASVWIILPTVPRAPGYLSLIVGGSIGVTKVVPRSRCRAMTSRSWRR